MIQDEDKELTDEDVKDEAEENVEESEKTE